MTLSEYLGQDNIFQHILTINPELSFLDSDKLNKLLLINYGDKTIFKKIEPYGLVMVAEFLNTLHGDNWLDLTELNIIQNDLINGTTRTITETINHNENNVNVSDTVNKTSAFNTDDLINDGGSNTTNNNDLSGNKTRTLTDSKTDLKTLYNNLSLAHKNSIINIVLNDVKDFLTLSIYE